MKIDLVVRSNISEFRGTSCEQDQRFTPASGSQMALAPSFRRIRLNPKRFLFALLPVTFCLLLLYRYYRFKTVRDHCLELCQHLLFMDSNGRVHVTPAYFPFRLGDRDRAMVINGSLINLTNTVNGQTVPCKYHAVQMAFFTQERPKKELYGKYALTGNLLLQMRHDAMIGLPGGGVQIGETIEHGLTRELHEEMGIQTLSDLRYFMSYSNPTFHYCGHLYLQEMSFNQLRGLAQQAFNSPDSGLENLGYLFVPTLNEVLDTPGSDGLPSFLAQAIAPHSPPTLVGNTLQQIMHVLTEATVPAILNRQHMQLGIDRACQLLARIQCDPQRGTDTKGTGATMSNFFQ